MNNFVEETSPSYNVLEKEKLMESPLVKETVTPLEKLPTDIISVNEENMPNIFDENSEESSEELSDFQKYHLEDSIPLEDGVNYNAVITDIKHSNSKNLDVITITLRVFVDNSDIFKDVEHCYFFTVKSKRVNYDNLVQDTSKLNFKFSNDDLKSYSTMVKALKSLIGFRVLIKPSTRVDSNTGISYQNFKFIEMLERAK